MFGSGFYAVCQFGLLAALTKIGDPRMAGQYTIGLAVSAPVMIFLGFNLRAVIVSDVHRECPFGVYLAFRLLAMATSLCAIGVIVFIAGYRFETAAVIMLIALAKSIEAISDIFFGYFQQNERMDQITLSMIVRGILSVLLFIDGMWIFGGILGGIAGLITAWLTTLVLFDIPRAVRFAKHRALHQQSATESFYPKWDMVRLKRLLLLSAPLGVVAMIVSLNANIPRYFVEAWHGEAVLGIFGPISYFMVIGNMVVMALGQSAAPRMARHYAQRDRGAVIRLLVKQKAVGVCLGIAGVAIVAVAGPWILATVFGPEYAEAQGSRVFLLLIMASSISLVSCFSGFFLTAIRAFWTQIPLRLCSVSVMLLCSAMLIPSHGITGAAEAILISTAFHAVILVTTAIFLVYRMQDSGKNAEPPSELIGQNAWN